MNGAESLVKTLVESGVEVCFSNPGTSEMHFVSALDKVGGIRCVLGLFEGVVTGAADGYARMSGKPAVTLLHLGPGLGNGLANLHNAKKANGSVVNIVGDHALWHLEHDAPLTADIEGIAKPVSHWVKTSHSADEVSADAAIAVSVAASYPGKIATMILPANTAWETATATARPVNAQTAEAVAQQRIDSIAQLLDRHEPTAFILGGDCVRAEALEYASQIAEHYGVTLFAQNSNARFERGAGRVSIRSVPYVVDAALELLAGFKHLVIVNAKAPVAFFAYPSKPSQLYPPEATVHTLADIHEDGVSALHQLVAACGATHTSPHLQNLAQPALPEDGELNPSAINTVLAALMPENTVIVDEAITSGRDAQAATAAANPHDWLQICGGAIGDGFPLATGAAIACPDRQVIGLQADGSGMYTLQALWTQARESLNILTIIYANRSYAILKHELKNVEADSGDIAHDMMELNRPQLDYCSLAAGMGVSSQQVTTVSEFIEAFKHGLEFDGPYLIEAVLG